MTAIKLTLARRAGILCNDPAFCRFVARQADLPSGDAHPSAAAEWLRLQCRVDSRRDLDISPAAATRFEAVLTAFDAFRGRIAPQERS